MSDFFVELAWPQQLYLLHIQRAATQLLTIQIQFNLV